jgi:hypothetical protein
MSSGSEDRRRRLDPTPCARPFRFRRRVWRLHLCAALPAASFPSCSGRGHASDSVPSLTVPAFVAVSYLNRREQIAEGNKNTIRVFLVPAPARLLGFRLRAEELVLVAEPRRPRRAPPPTHPREKQREFKGDGAAAAPLIDSEFALGFGISGRPTPQNPAFPSLPFPRARQQKPPIFLGRPELACLPVESRLSSARL